MTFLKNKIQIDKILLLGFVITFFSKDFFFNFYFRNIYIDIFSYTYFILVFCFYIDFKISTWKKIFFITLLISGYEISIKIMNNYSILPLLKQLFPMIIIYISTYFFIKKNSFKTIFDYYLRILFLVCVFGIIQSIVENFFSIYFFQAVPGRIDSIFREPSHFALLIIPGFIYGILNFKQYKFFTFIYGVNLILTFSVAGFLTLIISFFLILVIKKDRRKNLYISSIFILLTIMSILIFKKNLDNNGFLSSILKKQIIYSNNNYENNIKRLIFDNNSNNYISDLGLYSLFSNLAATANMLINNPLGSGLGGHEEAYYQYTNKFQMYHSFYTNNKLKRYGYNSKSAHNLLIRLFSEFGVIFLIIIIFIFGYLIVNLKKYTNDQKNTIIACLSYLIFRFIKLGGYFDYGIYFFISVLLIVIFQQNESTKRYN